MVEWHRPSPPPATTFRKPDTITPHPRCSTLHHRHNATRAPGCILTAGAGNTPTKKQTRRQRPRNWCHGGAASAIPTAGNLQEVGQHRQPSSSRTPSRRIRGATHSITEQDHTRLWLHPDSSGVQSTHQDADMPTTATELVPWWSGNDHHRRRHPS